MKLKNIFKMSQNFLTFNFLHPIVISEITSFSSKIPGKNLLKSITKDFVLENSHKNKQVFLSRFHPESLQFKNFAGQWSSDTETRKFKRIKYYLNIFDDIDVNIQDRFRTAALYSAAYYRSAKLVKLLLERDDIDVNVQGTGGETALHEAVRKGLNKIVKMLLDANNINVNLPDNYGRTALYWASVKRNPEIVKMLLERDDIDVNVQNNKGLTALHEASWHGSKEIVRMLLGTSSMLRRLTPASTLRSRKVDGIDVNIQDKNGRTALHDASEQGHKEIVEMLLQVEDIDVMIMDDGGFFAAMIASGEGHDEIAQILETHVENN